MIPRVWLPALGQGEGVQLEYVNEVQIGAVGVICVVGIGVGVGIRVGVGVSVGVRTGIGIGVRVGVGAGVIEGAGVNLGVGVREGEGFGVSPLIKLLGSSFLVFSASSAFFKISS